MPNEKLFESKAVVEVLETRPRIKYQANLYLQRVSLCEAISEEGYKSPVDLAEELFKNFLDNQDYLRLPEPALSVLAEYDSERKKDPEKAEARTSITKGRNLIDWLEFEISIFQRPIFGRRVFNF